MPYVIGVSLRAANVTRGCDRCEVPARTREVASDLRTVNGHADLESIRPKAFAVRRQVTVIGVCSDTLAPGMKHAAIVSSHYLSP